MATKKAASTTKKSSAKKPASKKQQTTKVTTVKAVESRPAEQVASKKPARFSFLGMPMLSALIAEFLGTFLLAAVVIASRGEPIYVLFALTGIVLAVGALSGAYVNPALTIGAWLTKRMSGMRALGYIVAQVLGAMLALVVLKAYYDTASEQVTAFQPFFTAAALPENKEWYAFFGEVLGTALFGFAVAAATREIKERTAAAFTVGTGLFLGLMVAGSAMAYVGASAILNPAVAVAIEAFNFETLWPLAVYALGTTLGAVVGFFLYDLLRGKAQKEA